MGERIRGRKGQELRARRLKAHPLCAECEKAGLVKATDVIDHIQPLAMGGEDVDENVQGLCHLCHEIKTATEQPSGAAVSNHPAWLEPALGRLRIVCGPPCSGKSTYVRKHAAESDLVIDLDDILARIHPGYRPYCSPIDSLQFNQAIRVRNALLGSLSKKPARDAWFIVGAPTVAERDWWVGALGGEVILLEADRSILKARALERGPIAYPACAAAIDRWHVESRGRWHSAPKRKAPRLAFGADGYPLSEDGE